MKKKTINTAIFFTLLFWMLVLILVINNKLIFKKLTIVPVLILVAINLVLILFSPLLRPVFELVLKGTQKIGSLIFGLITAVVYFFILTPIALFKRLTGKRLMEVGYEPDKESYYLEWEPSGNIEKQY